MTEKKKLHISNPGYTDGANRLNRCIVGFSLLVDSVHRRMFSL